MKAFAATVVATEKPLYRSYEEAAAAIRHQIVKTMLNTMFSDGKNKSQFSNVAGSAPMSFLFIVLVPTRLSVSIIHIFQSLVKS